MTIDLVGSASSGSPSSAREPTSARPQRGAVLALSPEPPHPRSWGWGGLASGPCFSPSVGRQRLPLSLSWEFAAGLPLSAALELIPSAEVRHLLPRALLIPRGCPPTPPGLAGLGARRGDPPHVGRAASQPQAAAEGASVGAPGRAAMAGGGGERSARPGAAPRGQDARGGRGASAGGRGAQRAVTSGWRAHGRRRARTATGGGGRRRSPTSRPAGPLGKGAACGWRAAAGARGRGGVHKGGPAGGGGGLRSGAPG